MSERPTKGRESSGQGHAGFVVTDDAVSAWFVREIIPHEAILMAYLRHNWRNASEIADLRQEIYARVLQAARDETPHNPKRFLLTTARNLLINLVRHAQIVPMESFADVDSLGIAVDTPEPDRELIEREDIARLEAAMKKLPPRTREAVALAYFEGLPVKTIAKRMHVTQQAASKLIAKATLILGDVLFDKSPDRIAKP